MKMGHVNLPARPKADLRPAAAAREAADAAMTQFRATRAAAPQADPSAVRRAPACFEAATPFGAVRLQLPGAGVGMVDACEAALALHACDELLCALDAWAGLALDWRWPAVPSPGGGMLACVHWRPASAPAQHALLEMPWALLRSLPAPSGTIAAGLEWPPLPVLLAVSQFRLEPAELDRLEPGGAVVLPDSLLRPWQGLLRAADEPACPGAGVPVVLDTPTVPRLAGAPQRRAGGSADHDERIACEVRLAVAHPLPSDRLAGWVEGEALADVGPSAALWRCAGERTSALCLAAGRLMPRRAGWALAVEVLFDAAVAAAPAH